MDYQLPIAAITATTAKAAGYPSGGALRTIFPVRLSMRSGERLGGLLPGVDAASALVIAEFGNGSFRQSFHPLRLQFDSAGSASLPGEWSLQGVRSGAEGWAYFLGIPEEFFAPSTGQGGALSLAIQVVGHSAFRAESSFAGQVSVSLESYAETSWLPRFSKWVDQWIPVLLPEAFVASTQRARVEEPDSSEVQSHSICIVTLARPDSEEMPPSLRLDWDPVAWTDAVVEPVGSTGRGHHAIRGGCFITPEGRVSHWFGGRIGLSQVGFRKRVSKQLLQQAPLGQASWCFWTEPVAESPAGNFAEGPIRIRHPLLAWAWNRFSETPLDASPLYRQASDLLRDGARLRALRHSDWERLLYQGDAATRDELEIEVRAFYRKHAGVLVRLAEFQSNSHALSGTFHPLAAIAEFAASAFRRRDVT